MDTPTISHGIQQSHSTSMSKQQFNGSPKQTRAVELRIPHDQGLHIRKALLEAQEERVSFALVGHATLHSKYLLLVNSVVDVPEAEYIDGEGGASWLAQFNLQMIERASKARLASYSPGWLFGSSTCSE
jgi:hypothetical protein